MLTKIPTNKDLAEALTHLVDSLHQIYSRIQIKPVPPYEDEDFTIEVIIPKSLSLDEVLDECHKECIKIENEYNLFILPDVIYEE